MEVILSAVLLLIGLVMLCFGGNWLVSGGVAIAKKFRISNLVIGMTIVAFGTSSPELAASIAAAGDHSAIILGNIVGSNIANVGMVIGVAAILVPLAVQKSVLQKEIPIRNNLLSPWLPSQGLCMIYSSRGLGKTWMALAIAHAVASNDSFLSWETESPEGVLYIDGEMPMAVMQERLAQIAASSSKEITAPFIIITPDAQEFGIPDLSTTDGQERINKLISDETKLIVMDNLSSLTRTGKENEGESWLPVQEWALRLRSRGKTVLFIHHSGKGGQQRGTSRREDVLDTVIALKKPVDYKQQDGACFEVHFEKNRGLYGDDVKPFEVRLTSNATIEGIKMFEWTWKSLEASTFEKVCRLNNEGMSQGEIADELEINKSTVSRHVKRGREERKINLQNV